MCTVREWFAGGTVGRSSAPRAEGGDHVSRPMPWLTTLACTEGTEEGGSANTIVCCVCLGL